VDDEPRIHVEIGPTAGRGDRSGPDASSQRVVHEPTRWTHVAAVVVLAGVLVGGLVLSLGGGPYERPPPESPEDLASPDDAYTAAVARLGRARSFAYRGTVHATERSSLRPGSLVGDDVDVEGAVLLPHSITRERAVAPEGGPAVDTLTSGSTAWSRSASSRSELAGAPWERVAWTEPEGVPPSAPNPESLRSGRLGIALVVDLLRAAQDRRPGPADADGNQRLLATVPADQHRRAQFGDLAGAEVAVVLDDAGDVSDVRLTAGPADDRGVEAHLAIERLGATDLFTPADVGGPPRSAVDASGLAAVGLDLFEPSGLPAGWALVDARPTRSAPGVRCELGVGAGGCESSVEGCPQLGLDYVDLTAVSGGELSLTVASTGCLDEPGAEVHVGTAPGIPGIESFEAGRFVGWAEELPGFTSGAVADGDTTVTFRTDLAAADARAVLATLVPFDAATEPAVLSGVPSSS
jgi:hypothetical protein